MSLDCWRALKLCRATSCWSDVSRTKLGRSFDVACVASVGQNESAKHKHNICYGKSANATRRDVKVNRVFLEGVTAAASHYDVWALVRD